MEDKEERERELAVQTFILNSKHALAGIELAQGIFSGIANRGLAHAFQWASVASSILVCVTYAFYVHPFWTDFFAYGLTAISCLRANFLLPAPMLFV